MHLSDKFIFSKRTIASFSILLAVSLCISFASSEFPEQAILASTALIAFLIAILAINYAYLSFLNLMFVRLPLQNIICMIVFNITGSESFTMGLLIW